MMNSENSTNTQATRGRFIKGFISGMIAMAIIVTITVTMIFPLLCDKFNAHPAIRTVDCYLGFTDIHGVTIEQNADNKWELTADQDVLVWLDLPTTIEQLNGNVSSSYPYDVKAGETGTIKVEVYCRDNYTKYVGTLDFVAADDLTLGAVCHGTNLRNMSIGINNGMSRRFSWMKEGKHAYIHYPLYTSCAGEYNVYPIRNDQYGSGYDVDFDITAIGAPETLYVSDHPDGDPEKETKAQSTAEFMRTVEQIQQSDDQ